QLTEEAPPLPEGTPLELSQLIDKLLEKTPTDRVASAAEVLQVLEHIALKRAVAVAPTAVLAQEDAAELSARLAVARTERDPSPSAKRKRRARPEKPKRRCERTATEPSPASETGAPA